MKKQVGRLFYVGLVFMLIVFATNCGVGKTSEKPEPKPPKETEQLPKPPDVDKIIQTGIAQLDAGAINKAISSFENALALEPDNSQAPQYLEQALAIREQLIEEHLRQGIEYFTNEQLENAMIEWEKILALDPSHEEALKYKELTKKMLDILEEGK
jgi:tetratricopeptide (TPR) repeat protein